MNRTELISALEPVLGVTLATDLVDEFVGLRQDVATRTLGRGTAGKFVETLVQILQYLEIGSYQAKPAVDEYLRKIETRSVAVDDGLRICASRIGRAMYSIRNKRSIAHKGEVDPNRYDLEFLLHGAQWIMAEILRTATRLPMSDTGRLIAAVQTPIGAVVEDFGEKRIVLAEVSTREEILILLHSHHPDGLPLAQLTSSMARRSPDTVRKAVKRLWQERFVEGDAKKYQLTARGFSAAVGLLRAAA